MKAFNEMMEGREAERKAYERMVAMREADRENGSRIRKRDGREES